MILLLKDFFVIIKSSDRSKDSYHMIGKIYCNATYRNDCLVLLKNNRNVAKLYICVFEKIDIRISLL